MFMLVFLPSYWISYGPTNFLYFCDIALFITMFAIWYESAMLASAAAIGILIPQLLWAFDFGLRFVGLAPTGMTAYMFDENIGIFFRSLSLFHGWLPFLLIFLVWRLGYDKRGLCLWIIIAELLMLISYFFLPAPPAPTRIPGATNPPVNVNYVYGFSDAAPQSWMPEIAWLIVLMIGLPVFVFWPTHWVLSKWRTAKKDGLKTL